MNVLIPMLVMFALGAVLGFITNKIFEAISSSVAPARVKRVPRNHLEPEEVVCIQCHNSFWREQGSGLDYCSGCNSQEGVNDVPSHSI